MTVYRGQSIGGEQVAFIRQLIAEHPELSPLEAVAAAL